MQNRDPKRTMPKSWWLGLLVILIVSVSFANLAVGANKKWTFMVYMNADNNLETAGIADFLEMAQVGSDDNITIVVQFDRTDKYDDSFGNWTDCRRFYITQGLTPNNGNEVEDIGECNMADPSTLEDFIVWATTNYPADNYALIIWDHGDGWREMIERAMESQLQGEDNVLTWKQGEKSPNVERLYRTAGYDETSGDYLYMDEVQQALGNANVHFNLIGFDACLMEMIEVGYEMKDLADVMVGSEEVEPGGGWPYNTILSDLKNNPDYTASELAQAIVTRYGENYGVNSATTLSAFDLSQISDLATAVDNFALAMNSNWNELKMARAQVQTFCWQWLGHIDLYHFADLVSQFCTNADIVNAANDVKTAIDKTIIAVFHGWGCPKAHGVAIYFPERAKTYDIYDRFYEDSQHDFASLHWDEFVKNYLINTAPSITSSWTDNPPTIDGVINPAEWNGATVVDLGPVPTSWEWGEPHSGPQNAHSGTKCWATNLDGDYLNYEFGWIQTPVIDLSNTTSPQLTFWHWYNIENNYDHAYVQITTDNGHTWTTLATYTGDNSNSGWTEETIDLSAYKGRGGEVIIRFLFTSNYSITYTGWYIDDVEVKDGTDVLYSSNFEADDGEMEIGPNVKAYLMNDDHYLYIAIDNEADIHLDNYDDEVGIYFDDDHNHCWDTTPQTDEGNYLVEWLENDSALVNEFGGIWYDFSTYSYNFIDLVTAEDVVSALSTNTGHLQYEIQIDLTTGALQAQAGDEIGFFFWVYDRDNDILLGWPAGLDAHGRQWIEPLFYGNLRLAAHSNQPPVINAFTANPTSGNAPLTVNFNCDATDPDGTVVSYKWDFDGDGQIDQTTTTNTATHTYNSPGTYQAKVTVEDNDGAETTSEPITIRVTTSVQNQSPSITSFTADPTTGDAPLTVTFTCRANDPDGRIVKYTIDFDEGERQTNSSGIFTYTYYKAGEYTVTCWAEDNDGAQASRRLTLNLQRQLTPDGQIQIDDTLTYRASRAWIDMGNDFRQGGFTVFGKADFYVNLPTFESPMDVYIGIEIPQIGLYVLTADGQFVPYIDLSTTPAYKIGVTESVREEIFEDIRICSHGNQIPAGTYLVYVLAVPTNGGHLDQIDFSVDPYYFYYYSADVPTCPPLFP